MKKVVSASKHCSVDSLALMNFRGPWENILALWQYFKIISFQVKPNLPITLLNQYNIPRLLQ